MAVDGAVTIKLNYTAVSVAVVGVLLSGVLALGTMVVNNERGRIDRLEQAIQTKIPQDIAAVKSGIQDDITALRADMSRMQADTAVLKSQASAIQQSNDRIEKRLDALKSAK